MESMKKKKKLAVYVEEENLFSHFPLCNLNF